MWGLNMILKGDYLVPLLINRASQYRLTIGGLHRLGHWMYKYVYKAGGRAWTSQRVKRVIMENGRASGVELMNGEITKSKIVYKQHRPLPDLL